MSRYNDRVRAADQAWRKATARAEQEASVGPDSAAAAAEARAAADYARSLVGLDPKGGQR